MSCAGLHCAGCAGGSAVPVVALTACLGIEWVVEHLVEVVAVSATCGVLAVAAVVALMRWGERRDAARRQLWTARAEALPPRETSTLRGGSARPALGPSQVHLHFHGLPATEQAAIIHQAIPGRLGDAAIGKEE